MPGARVFVDTNIWIYAHLRAPDDARHGVALERLASESQKVISPQVIAEYYNVMLRNRQSDAWIQANLKAIFACTRLQPLDAKVVNSAISLRQRYKFSYWDCQIAAAALVSGCGTLLSEDLQHGQVLEDHQHGQVLEDQMTVVNPFPAS